MDSKLHRIIIATVVGLISAAIFLIVPGEGVAGPTAVDADPFIGPPFTFTKSTQPNPVDESAPALVYNPIDREFLAVWHNSRPFSDDDIYAQRVSINGELLSWFHVDNGAGSGERANPVVAFNPHHNDYLVVYRRCDPTGGLCDVRARRVSLLGPLATEFTITNSAYNYTMPVVAFNIQQDEYLVAWEEGTSPNKEIWGRRVAGEFNGGDDGGQLIGPRNHLTSPHTDDCRKPDLTFNPGRNEYGLAFERYIVGSGIDTIARLITASGVFSAGNQIILSQAEQPAIAAHPDGNQFWIAYKSMGDTNAPNIWLAKFQADFSPGFSNTPLSQGANDMVEPDIARLGDTDLFQVVWEEGSGAFDVRGIRVSASSGNGPAFDVAVASTPWEQKPAVADGAPVTLAAWEDNGWGTSSVDIAARLLGYQLHLPLVFKD